MSAPRVLILYCEEGEGHASAARAIAVALKRAGAEPVVHDALHEGLGRLIPWCGRDLYRLQVRCLRWTYGVEYFLFARLPPTRALARLGLALFGARPLRRVIERYDPGVVVSTHPAVTNVLGSLRRRGRVTVPTIATITDFGVHGLWANAGIDVHLVMHERSVPAVERVAGPEAAQVVDAIVGERFRGAASQRDSRLALGLPLVGPVAVVSGGGWGVGGVEEAALAALGVPGLTTVCLTGRNEVLQRRLEHRFGPEERIHVWPFTDRIPELLASADVLVDSTLGMTCLEALSVGCRVIAFGAPPGHSRDNARALAALGLAKTARSSAELTGLLARIADERPPTAVLPDGAKSPADAILTARMRAQSRRRRTAPAFGLASAAAFLTLTGWSFASPTPYPLFAKTFDLGGLSGVTTEAAVAGVIVEAPEARIPRLARALGARGIHASFAVAEAPSPQARAAIASRGDALLPAASHPRTPGVAMVRFSARLRTTARRLGLGGHFYYLRPRGGFTLGDYVAARITGGRLVAPSIVVAPGAKHLDDLRAGRIVLVDAQGAYAPDSITALADLLSSRRLRGVSLPELLALAASARATVGERASATAPPPTRSSPRTSPPAREADAGQSS